MTDAGTDAPPYVLRPPRAGDFGWVVARHGALYAAESGYTLVAEEAHRSFGHDLVGQTWELGL